MSCSEGYIDKAYLCTFPLILRQNCPYTDAKEICLVDLNKALVIEALSSLLTLFVQNKQEFTNFLLDIPIPVLLMKTCPVCRDNDSKKIWRHSVYLPHPIS